MTDYNAEQAWKLLQQFSQDFQTPTLYLADGTPLDTLNTGTEDFGSYSVGPSAHDLRITNPWDPSLPENQSSYSAYKQPSADGSPLPGSDAQTNQSKLVMYLAIASVAISLLVLVRQ